jgi:excisionase family DNA binding protein
MTKKTRAVPRSSPPVPNDLGGVAIDPYEEKFATAPPKICYSIAEAKAATGMSVTTIYGLIARNVLEARKSGTRTLISAESLHAWFSSLPQSA